MDEYTDQVRRLESDLAAYAMKSFDPDSPKLLDGTEVVKHFADRWQTTAGRTALNGRSPIQLERDRILHSPGMRKQAEKYHVLYNGQRRLMRSFVTHTMRVAQVSRSIARGLDLNQDFAEALALGCKVGASPFVHAAKAAVDSWVRETLTSLDQESVARSGRRDKGPQLFSPEMPLPEWVQRLESEEIFASVRRFMPWAAGTDVGAAYSTGQESYWMLALQPFTVEARNQQYVPETMFGIWRHSRNLQDRGHVFHHRIDVTGERNVTLEITGEHLTFEALVVQYADDITWAIENLDDANSAALLNRRPNGAYEELRRRLPADAPSAFRDAVSDHDSGALYTYFISDFVTNGRNMLNGIGAGDARHSLRSGLGEAMIGLTAEAERMLQQIVMFLQASTFSEPRVQNRFDMLKEVSRQCVRLLYRGDREGVQRFIEDRAALELWPEDLKRSALELLTKDVHRLQLAVDVFAGMSDQEIYDFVGIQSL